MIKNKLKGGKKKKERIGRKDKRNKRTRIIKRKN